MSADTENTPAPEAPQSPAVVKKAADTIAKAKPPAIGKPIPKPENRPVGIPVTFETKETPRPQPPEKQTVSDALSIFGWDLE